MTARNGSLGRRGAGLLATALLGACVAQPRPAGAQQPPRPPGGTAPAGNALLARAVLSLPLPCADRPGDIVGLLLEGAPGGAAPTGTVAVFGQAFRRGALSGGARLGARLGNGRPVAAQLDAKARHPDGSVRFGVVSLALPAALAAGERLGVVLTTLGTAAPPLDLAAALAGRSAVLELTGPAGAEPWRADLVALARAAPAGTLPPWQAGPLAAQVRLSLPVPAAALGGIASLRLVADIAARADGTLWVDAWLRNDIAMRPAGGDASYAMRLSLDGREALAATELRHFQYQGWGRLLGAGPGGRPAPASPLVRMDTAYLAETGAVARYDLSTGVDPTLLERMAQGMAAPDWAAPLGARGINRYMPTTGGRPDIGPVTLFQAVWLQTGDARAAAYCLGQAEAAGGVPWHFWDPAGGADGRGGWMDVTRWPRFWLDARNGPPPRSLLQPPSRDSGWGPDTAHQPNLSFVPFLLTGRRAFLDHLQAQTAYNVLTTWPAMRTDRDVVVVNRNQVRGAAWGLRQMDDAAWITPEDDPNAPYMREMAQGNWSWLVSMIPEWTRMQGEAHGWLPANLGPLGDTPVWQQDFFASTVIASARRGNAAALDYLRWSANYYLGRFQQEARGFPFRDGAAFSHIVGDRPTGQLFQSWTKIGEEMVAKNQSNRERWVRTTDIRAALAILAGIEDLLPERSAGARAARLRLTQEAGEPAGVEAQARSPTWNVLPRGEVRVAGRAPQCRAG